ncbi:sensor histidine kinase [Ruminococcus flavefaciens]|uniref:histidine kinase n=1 Tax=Ruminococcus flavefaciens TaxID=1265 RepID=A0A1M7GNM2_RUMFL|nr:HAMP domain-containing sensor histidine kinase [Ruminococcus flavefaciens]SHM17755.1 Signal transduction histidine kinase [Ruminococcus flavefaciens]
MKSFNKIIAVFLALMAVFFLIMNIVLLRQNTSSVPLYKIETNRIEQELKNGRQVSADDYPNILGIYEYSGDSSFYSSDNEYVIKEINNKLYRIEYIDKQKKSNRMLIAVDIALAVFTLIILAVFVFIKKKLLKPFNELSTLPEQLSKRNLVIPLKEHKSRFFGKFVWGMDMLRQELEHSRQKSLEYAKNEKTFLLSLSHDIKTPLAAIKLYSKALSKGIYSSPEKQLEAAESINDKANEIEKIVNELSANLSSEFMDFDVRCSEFYLSDVMSKIEKYYSDKLSVIGTSFSIDEYSNCMLHGDADRLEEVLQNIIENAMKYGDGNSISISFSDEEDCRLITVTNTGCTLPDKELPHIFDSFWRGSNAGSQNGSGLGLYICRRLMELMGGSIFAEISSGCMNITVVCPKQT